MNYVLVKEDGTLETGKVKDYFGIQNLIGGYFTIVPILRGAILSPDLATYVHDEGLLLDLPRNLHAERLTGYTPLAGPMVIMGPADEEGNTLPLSDEWVDTIYAEVAS